MSDLAYIPTPEEAFERLEALSRLRASNIVIPKNPKFSRGEVVQAFASAFEMIGGVPRLALWANDNPTEFYKLFGKLLPSATMTEIVTRKDDGNLKTYTTEELEAILAEQSGNVIEMSDYVDSDSN